MQVGSQDARNMARIQERDGTFSLLSWSLLFAEPCQLAHAGTGHLLSALSKMNTPCLSVRQSSSSVSPSTSNLGLLRLGRPAQEHFWCLVAAEIYTLSLGLALVST